MVKAEMAETGHGPVEDQPVLVRDPQRLATTRALGVEDAGEKALSPVVAWRERPADQLFDALNVGRLLRANCWHLAMGARRPLRHEDVSRDIGVGQELACAIQRLVVDTRESEEMMGPPTAVRPSVRPRTDRAIAAEDPAEVAALVIARPPGSVGEAARAEQLVVGCQMRARVCTAIGPRHE